MDDTAHALYVEWYDAIFAEKDYTGEAAAVIALYEQQIGRTPVCVFDLGCGTGNHACAFQGTGCAIWGIDADQAMETKARVKGVRTGMPILPVDLAVALFHVVNYCLTLDALDKLLDMAYASTRLGGMFAFDAWNADLLEDELPEPTLAFHSVPAREVNVRRHKTPHPVKRSERIVVENVTEILPWKPEQQPTVFTWAYEHRLWKAAMLRNRLEAAGFTTLGQPREWNRRSLLWTAVK